MTPLRSPRLATSFAERLQVFTDHKMPTTSLDRLTLQREIKIKTDHDSELHTHRDSSKNAKSRRCPGIGQQEKTVYRALQEAANRRTRSKSTINAFTVPALHYADPIQS